MSVYRRTWKYFRPHLRSTVWALVFALLAIGFNLLKPWPIKYLIDNILTNPEESQSTQSTILLLCLLIVVFYGLWAGFNYLSQAIFLKNGQKVLFHLRSKLYEYLQTLPLLYHQSKRTSDTTFRVAYDSQSVQTIYHRGFGTVFTSLATLLGIAIVMFFMDWKLTLISLSMLPLVVILIKSFAKKIRHQSTEIQQSESAVLDTLSEGLQSLPLVYAYNQQNRESAKFRQQAKQSMEAKLELDITNLVSSLLAGLLMMVGVAAMYYLGANQVLDGRLQIGDLVVFAAYLTMLYTPLEQLAYTAWAMEGATAGAKRCFEVLDAHSDVEDAPDAAPLVDCQGGIRFDSVSFQYPDGTKVLQGLDLEVKPGETIGIVGASGSGKSTLLSLIPRFHDATSGAVRIDSHDVKDLQKHSLRSQISVVLQRTTLFSTTVKENIAYGAPNATQEEIIRAAKMANAHDFIQALPDGYNSLIGERGNTLSIGQQQRLSIARAFLRDTPILLLDEPTSAIDSDSEAEIVESINTLSKDRTTLIISHRLTTVRNLDRIIFLENGAIVESGTHSELISENGQYARYHRDQNNE